LRPLAAAAAAAVKANTQPAVTSAGPRIAKKDQGRGAPCWGKGPPE